MHQRIEGEENRLSRFALWIKQHITIFKFIFAHKFTVFVLISSFVPYFHKNVTYIESIREQSEMITKKKHFWLILKNDNTLLLLITKNKLILEVKRWYPNNLFAFESYYFFYSGEPSEGSNAF